MNQLLFLLCILTYISGTHGQKDQTSTYAHNFVANELGFITKDRDINIGKTVESMLLGINIKAFNLENYTQALVDLQTNMFKIDK